MRPFAERIVIYDDDSDDGTKEILLAHNKVEVRQIVRSDHNSLDLSRIALYPRKLPRRTSDRPVWVITCRADHES
jgi:hypothetical protein